MIARLTAVATYCFLITALALLLAALILAAAIRYAIAAESRNTALAADAPSPSLMPRPILKPMEM